MTVPFGSIYSSHYDRLYHDKNYGAECDLLERLFTTFSTRKVQTVLDLGCGTGNHSGPLAQRGYHVIGVDRSSDMLSEAKRKTGGIHHAEFFEGDVQTIRLSRKFDAVLMMFAVLGYQIGDEDVHRALETARAHLEPGGIFVFDVWYGPAVVHEKPTTKLKRIAFQDGELERTANGRLDEDRNVCIVDYHLRHIENGQTKWETNESHAMRYFFPKELERFLKTADLQLLGLGAFPEFERQPDEKTWNVIGVARIAAQ